VGAVGAGPGRDKGQGGVGKLRRGATGKEISRLVLLVGEKSGVVVREPRQGATGKEEAGEGFGGALPIGREESRAGARWGKR
jgi:hypothetical protein